MIKDTITVRFNVSNNPWIAKYKEITFSKKKLQHIADEIIENCSDKNYSTAHSYNKHIADAINIQKVDVNSRRPLMLALKSIISKQKPKGTLPWNNSYIAAIRSLDELIAYSTPGFIEARAYNQIYGS